MPSFGYVLTPALLFIAISWILFSIHSFNSGVKLSPFSFAGLLRYLNAPEYLFALDRYSAANVSIKPFTLKDYFAFIKNHYWIVLGMTLGCAAIGASFSLGWFYILNGALIGLLLPYLYKVTEEFFGREIKRNMLQAEEVKKMAVLKDKPQEFQALVSDYEKELNRASSREKWTYYRPVAFFIFFKLAFPVVSGIISFTRSRLVMAMVSGIASHSFLPLILSPSVASWSVLNIGLAKLIPAAVFLPLPHTVAGLLGIFILVMGLRLVDFRQARQMRRIAYARGHDNALPETMDGLTPDKLTAMDKNLLYFIKARPAQRRLALEGTNLKKPWGKLFYLDIRTLWAVLLSFLGKDFWRSFLYMSTISAEIGAVLDSCGFLAGHPWFSWIGEPLNKIMEAFERNALGWGQAGISGVEKHYGILFSQVLHNALGGNANVADWWAIVLSSDRRYGRKRRICRLFSRRLKSRKENQALKTGISLTNSL